MRQLPPKNSPVWLPLRGWITKQKKKGRPITFDYMYEAYAKCTSLRVMAKATGLSHETISRVFKNYVQPHQINDVTYDQVAAEKRILKEKVAFERIKAADPRLVRLIAVAEQNGVQFAYQLDTNGRPLKTVFRLSGHVVSVQFSDTANRSGKKAHFQKYHQFHLLRRVAAEYKVEYMIFCTISESNVLRVYVVPISVIDEHFKTSPTVYMPHDPEKKPYNNQKSRVSWKEYQNAWKHILG